MNKIHISNVMKKFNLLTNLAIVAYDLDGIPLGASGYGQSLYDFFDRHKIYKTITDQYFSTGKNVISPPSCNSIDYLIAPVCPRNIHRGVFIIGPIASNSNACIDAPYKPKDIYSYILKSLRLICKDFPNKYTDFDKGQDYSIHVKKAIDYMDTKYMDDLRLEDVSNYLKINKSYFSTMFKKETNMGFSNFLSEIRVEKSKDLLRSTDYNMLDISIMVGFNNQNYYNIIFKKITGLTPLEYRKKYSFTD